MPSESPWGNLTKLALENQWASQGLPLCGEPQGQNPVISSECVDREWRLSGLPGPPAINCMASSNANESSHCPSNSESASVDGIKVLPWRCRKGVCPLSLPASGSLCLGFCAHATCFPLSMTTLPPSQEDMKLNEGHPDDPG